MLRLDDDRGVVVGGLHVLSHLKAVAMRSRDAEPALAGGSVFRRLDDAPCVLDGVDLRCDDAGGADVERPLYVQVVACRQADDAGCGAGALHQRLHLCGVEGRMLGVDEEPVESHLGEQLGYGRGIQGDERRDEALTRPQSRAKGCRHLMNCSARPSALRVPAPLQWIRCDASRVSRYQVATSSLSGQSILHYNIHERLGSGGSGEVYVADDTRLGRRVALKFLHADRQRDADSRARLLREARAASMLQSPNIAVTYEFAEYEGLLFIAMEYVEGEVLSERIARGPVPLAEAVDIAAQVADALDEAHGRSIVHRDIKSGNLIQTRRGLVKVLDFGLAKMEIPQSTETVLRSTPELLVTSPGMVLGTIAYMAPEQLRADAVDHRVDLFALGVVLYELITARLPFRGATLADTFDRIFHHEPESVSRFIPAVPTELERIVRKALQKVPENRYQSARELQNDLRHVARRLEVDETTRRLAVPRIETGQRSIAVLTFTNVTRDAADDWIGTGIAETVTADLKNVPNLAVIGRGQISELLNAMGPSERASEQLPIDIGRRLGAWWVLSGAYQRLGERIRVTVQLLEVLTGKLIRTVKADGHVNEIFELQDRIVYDVSRGLELKLEREDAEAIERDETRSIEAFEAYSRGVLNLRSAGREAMDRAIGLFERAVALDESYAAAWSALGGALYLKGQFLEPPGPAAQGVAASAACDCAEPCSCQCARVAGRHTPATRSGRGGHGRP